MEIIALSGFARSGKDEAAKVLVEDFGFKQVAFADKLRDFLYAMNPIVAAGTGPVCSEMIREGIKPRDYVFYVQDVIDKVGWDGYKNTKVGPEIRRLLQRLGTEAGRQTLGDTIWIDAALTGFDDDARIVVSDSRFFNEFEAVRERGGYVWRIEREGVGPQSDHASETEAPGYKNFSLYLHNNGTLEEWKKLINKEYTAGRYKEWN